MREWEVEAILGRIEELEYPITAVDQRTRKEEGSVVRYLVQWKDYNMEDSSWEPRPTCRELRTSSTTSSVGRCRKRTAVVPSCYCVPCKDACLLTQTVFLHDARCWGEGVTGWRSSSSLHPALF